MADLTLKDLTAPVDDLMQFIPPASSAYKSYLFPGFYSAGQTPSITPNPVMGDNAVAAPAAGEPSYVAPPEAPIQGPTMLSSLRSISPGGGNGSSVDERAATRAADVKSAGEVTDPMDAAKAVMNGLGFLSGTGVATNAIGAAASAAGINPLDSIFGNSWDLKSNTNLKPGYSAAYDAAYKTTGSPQAALNAAKAAVQDDAASAPFGVHRNQAATPSPTPVTQANSVTGFQRPGAPAAPSAPAAGSGVATANAPLATTSTAAPAAPALPAAPVAPIGRPSGYGAAGAISPNNSYAGAMGSANPTDLANRDRGAGGSGAQSGGNGGGVGSNAGRRGFAIGGVVPDDSAQMFRAATQSAAPANVGQGTDPYQDERYNPPAEAQDPQGVVDGVPANLTPGEFVIMRDAAQDYDPDVLAALNDPRIADQINELIKGLLGGPEQTDNNDDPSVSDDNSGLGVAGQTASQADPRSTMSAVPRGGSMLRNLSRVG